MSIYLRDIIEGTLITGPQGPQGATGPTGPQGDIGPQGPTGPQGSLNDLNDVTITTPSSGQVLKYNGSAWINDTDATGSNSSGIYSNTYVVSGTTTNATETEIFIDGIANSRIPISSNTSMMYIVETLAKRTDVLGDMASIELKSSAINNNGTVSDVGDVYEIVIARTDANILVDCRADNTNKSIGIYVTGVAGKTINWRAVVTTIEL